MGLHPADTAARVTTGKHCALLIDQAHAVPDGPDGQDSANGIQLNSDMPPSTTTDVPVT